METLPLRHQSPMRLRPVCTDIYASLYFVDILINEHSPSLADTSRHGPDPTANNSPFDLPAYAYEATRA